MTDPIPFPSDRSSPIPEGVSVRYGDSEDLGRPAWVVWHNDGRGNVHQIGAHTTREEAERFVTEWRRPPPTRRFSSFPMPTTKVRVLPGKVLPVGPRTMRVPYSIIEPEPRTITAKAKIEPLIDPRPIRATVRLDEE